MILLSPDSLHPRLRQQLETILGAKTIAAPEWEAFLRAVNDTYFRADLDRENIENLLELSAKDLLTAQASMRAAYHRLIYSSPDGIFVFDRALLCTEWNPGMMHLTGLSEASVRGKPIVDALKPLAYEDIASFVEVLLDSTVVIEEHIYQLPQGGIGYLTGYLAPLRDQANQVIGGLGVLRNVTESKRVAQMLEAHLRETMLLNRVLAATASTSNSKQLLEKILIEITDALRVPQGSVAILNARQDGLMVVADFQSADRPSIVGVVIPLENHLATQYVLREGKPLAIADAQHDARLEVAHDMMSARGMASMLLVPLVVHERVLGTLELDSYVPREFTPAEIQLAQSVAAAVGQTLENARLFEQMQAALAERQRAESERLAVERKMLEAQKLESLGVLAGGIAHDFNNLLVGMMGHAGLALLELPQQSRAREHLEQIQVGAQRAVELTHQMLAYAGKGRFIVQPVAVNEVIEEMAKLLRVSISKQATLLLHLAPALPPISADVTQFRQVLMNLITNASDALDGRAGTITVSTGLAQLDRAALAQNRTLEELPPGEYVFVEVADTGVGMDAETQARIFEPFFTTKVAGRGLGLAGVQGILRGHQGAIQVTSEPGQGSIFRLLFPPSAATEISAQTVVEPNSKYHGKILVVDDEAAVREITVEILRQLGYQAAAAENGARAVELAAAARPPFDCVLLDLTMSGLSSEETLRALRQTDARLAVVIMTGLSEQEVVARFGKLALDGFLPKPFTAHELHSRLQSALAQIHHPEPV
jgi:PAS domain S-box-containing protein